ncbi:MAG TPA: hypothetical protein VGX76_16410 [Pirellulales bacterium]|nr:hypothetical protein [Pirellulales bacterium]
MGSAPADHSRDLDTEQHWLQFYRRRPRASPGTAGDKEGLDLFSGKPVGQGPAMHGKHADWGPRGVPWVGLALRR